MVRAAVIIGAIALAGVAWRLAPQAEKARVVPDRGRRRWLDTSFRGPEWPGVE